jgi:hypothetical protein
MQIYGAWTSQFHVFLATELLGSEFSASRNGGFTQGYRTTGTHWIWGCVHVDGMEKYKFLTLPWLVLRLLSLPTGSLAYIDCPEGVAFYMKRTVW